MWAGRPLGGSAIRWLSLAAVIALSLSVAMTVESATEPTGNLNVPAGMTLQLKVAGKVVTAPTGRDMPIAVGKYQSVALTCDATLANAAGKAETWKIGAVGPTWGKLKDIPILEDKTTAIDAGPPFTLKTVIYEGKTEQGVRVIPFTVHVFGKAGEQYDLNTFKKQDQQAPELTFQVVDEAGKVLTTGTLPYG
jgi:hypothetical protein